MALVVVEVAGFADQLGIADQGGNRVAEVVRQRRDEGFAQRNQIALVGQVLQ